MLCLDSGGGCLPPDSHSVARTDQACGVVSALALDASCLLGTIICRTGFDLTCTLGMDERCKHSVYCEIAELLHSNNNEY